jgi:hypothetical protein
VNFGWPGNFPQRQQVVRDTARQAHGAIIGVEHLADYVGGSVRHRRQLSRLEALEREAIVDALRDNGGNRAQLAAAPGLSRSVLHRRLRQFGLDSNRAIVKYRRWANARRSSSPQIPQRPSSRPDIQLRQRPRNSAPLGRAGCVKSARFLGNTVT